MAKTLEEIMAEAIAGSIWATPPPSEQPSINLIRWSVMAAQTGERYLVGYNMEDREGRVSTPITSFDASKAEAVTKSGRVYRLKGKPGADPDGQYVWSHVCRVRAIVADNVSAEYETAIALLHENSDCLCIDKEPVGETP
ncbi:hypothetical protein M1B72_02610 [Geomonas paludis]|uniref:Uncharacterized protein n=1 Tax=Geomonas paludis TaxID=2740185 RepID=A0A6V8N038_9BACT|nr:hypothetical protein [Geomonas paludis]UPU36615.1 hypothetical protein M1B72_02610 [Geomonas paludis]GFO65876.1 hypothetical protein GMPD_37950 [Geomonas paludis]